MPDAARGSIPIGENSTNGVRQSVFADLCREGEAALRAAMCEDGGIGALARCHQIPIATTFAVGFIGLERIRPCGRMYEPAEDGLLALVVPVSDVWPISSFEGEPTVYDLVAFDPRNPNQWWLRTGYAAALNAVALDISSRTIWASDADPPLRLFRNPLSWLRNECNGVVILDRKRTRTLLASVPRILPEDDVHAHELHGLLHVDPPDLPKIVLRRTAAKVTA